MLADPSADDACFEAWSCGEQSVSFKGWRGDGVAVAVSFDLFGTLVAVDRPSDPAAALARELRARGVSVPSDWSTRYREPQVTYEPGQERPLSAHVSAALASAAVDVDDAVVQRAVHEAFDGPVRTRDGARAAVDAAAERGAVGILSNCSVSGLVERTLERSELDPDRFDAVVASVDCGWRKPDRRAFEAVASALDVPLADLVHVGDDPETDGGADAVGARALVLEDRSLADVRAQLEAIASR